MGNHPGFYDSEELVVIIIGCSLLELGIKGRLAMETKGLRVLLVIVLLVAASWGVVNAADTESNYQQGVNHYRQGNYEEAISYLIEAVAENTDGLYLHYMLGLSYKQVGKYEFAET